MSSGILSKHPPISEVPVGNGGPFLSLTIPDSACWLKVRYPLGMMVRVDCPWTTDADPRFINKCRAAYSYYNTDSKSRKDKKSVRK